MLKPMLLQSCNRTVKIEMFLSCAPLGVKTVELVSCAPWGVKTVELGVLCTMGCEDG